MVLNITFGNQVRDENCGSDCCICTEVLDRNGMCNLRCSHTFHIECISRWFEAQDSLDSTMNCPYCRGSISESERDILSKLASLRRG